MFGFGSNSTASFPPAQPASNPFAATTTSSFPPSSFGSNNNNSNGAMTQFNAQPDMNFGSNSPAFGGSTPTNGGFTFGAQSSQQPAFGASNTPAAAPASASFTFGAAANKDSTAPASTSLFGDKTNDAPNSASTGGLFGAAPTPQSNAPFTFGQSTNTPSASTPASNIFGATNNGATPSFQFGASTPGTPAQQAASTPKALFGDISASVQASTSETPKPLFGSISNTTSQAPATTATSSLFGTNSTGGFQFGGANSTAASGQSETTTAPASSTPAFSFGNAAAKPDTPSAPSNLFGNLGATTKPASTSTAPPMSFGGFTPSSQAPSSDALPSLGLFSQSQNKAPATPISKPLNTGSATAPPKKLSSMFGGSQYVQRSFVRPTLPPLPTGLSFLASGLHQPSFLIPPSPFASHKSPFATPRPKYRQSRFRKDIIYKLPSPPRRRLSRNLFRYSISETMRRKMNDPKLQEFFNNGCRFTSELKAAEASNNEPAAAETATPAQIEEPAKNPFAALSKPAANTSNNLFQSPKPSTPAPASASTSTASTSTPAPAPAASLFAPAPAPAATSVQETPKTAPAPPVPRVTVPPNWNVDTASGTNILDLVHELTALNDAYRAKLAQLPATADWSALSKFHSQKSSEIKKKIDDLKKQAATAKGVTGEESVLSTKRKNDEPTQSDFSVKKVRSDDPPSTPNSKSSALPSTTPKTAPPAKGFNLFAASTSQDATPPPKLFGAPATDKPAEKKSIESASVGGFKPNLGTSSTSASTGFKPNFGASSTGKASSGGFFGQFGGKTKEQLRKERLKKALDAGYESPTTSEEEEGNYETKEQWIARWNREEDARQAEMEAAASKASQFVPSVSGEKSDAPAFTFTPASSNVASTSQSLASGASTPGLLNSRVGSPAPSTDGGRSVFDTPFGAQTPNNNLFGHLSAASSQHQDDSDDEADDESASKTSTADDAKKRRLADTGDAESESSETLEESMRRKKPAAKPSSLADRITRDNSEAAPDAADKDSAPSLFSNTNSNLFNMNGSQTPAPKKPFQQFDFAGAAAQSAPPKQAAFAPKTDTFAGDQTFKFGSPIKFSASTTTAPFGAKPAAESSTPAKPAANPFAFLNAGNSAATSAVSSRAATPATDAEASSTDAAANEEEAQNFVDNDDKSLLSDAERTEFTVLFEHPETIVTKLVKKEGEAPKWQKIANGRLWILKSNEDASVIVRLRMKSGAVRLNNRIVPGLKSSVAGATQSQVRAVAPYVKEDGSTGMEDVILAFKAGTVAEKQELAGRFSEVYNENV